MAENFDSDDDRDGRWARSDPAHFLCTEDPSSDDSRFDDNHIDDDDNYVHDSWIGQSWSDLDPNDGCYAPDVRAASDPIRLLDPESPPSDETLPHADPPEQASAATADGSQERAQEQALTTQTRPMLLRLGNPEKAGTQGANREKINQAVYEITKGSAFFVHQQKRDKVLEAKIDKIKIQAAELSKAELEISEGVVKKRLAKLEESRDLKRCVVHVDMDAFYASVEELDRPELKTKPMGVGSAGLGVLCTANYEARKYGVRSAMPGYIALKLCPELILIRPNFEKYLKYAKIVRGVFEVYDPNYRSASLDEAYLDITDYLAAHPGQSPPEVAQELRDRIFSSTGLTASAGIAPNPFLAKVCSDINKPNGQKFLLNDRTTVVNFTWNLPIRKIPGIGYISEQMLGALDIKTIKELHDKLPYVHRLFGTKMYEFLSRVSIGISRFSVFDRDSPQKSIGVERTFTKMSDYGEMHRMVKVLAQMLADDLKEKDLKGKTVTLKLKTSNFQVYQRSKTLTKSVWLSSDLHQVGRQILDDVIEEFQNKQDLNLRLMGLRISHVGPVHDEHGIEKYLTKREGESSKCDLVPASENQSLEQVICPICSEDITALSPQRKNAHVDQCLGNETQPQHQPSSKERHAEAPHRGRPPKKRKVAPAEPARSLGTEPRSKSQSIAHMIQRQGVSASRPTESSHSVAEAALPLFDGSHPEQSVFQCPICNRALESVSISDLPAINRHIDTCIAWH
ncbi:uncharacterized protein BJ171DRAFT_296650 [Polychytrium aggregatum]|uniref:uncharacterized protein n=1 Tax=Polychytrium aggregatum TaxID=110093 RepID=UPI0022FECF77|nr:uncharacterized protein BJ171DRAFT_296650 [Polychytrium aggregatum]KAI9207378.1 hypothetical protein BJ171DRAFT_296650 [Polychytrium aggregatum]